MPDQPSTNSPIAGPVGPELASAICRKVLSGPTFQSAPRLSRLLETCVEAYASSARPALSDDDRSELKRLRRKLDDYAEAEGAGDPVRINPSVSDGAVSFAIENPAADLAAWSATAILVQTGAPESSRRTLILAAVALIAVIAAGVWYFSIRFADPGHVRILAVLPIDDGRPIQLHDKTVPGITASLTVQLSHATAFRTTAYSSAIPYAYNAREMEAIRQSLHADAIVEGKLTPTEDTIEGELWMRRTSDGRRTWQTRFSTSRADPLSALDKAAQEIAARLGATLPAHALLTPKSGKPSQEAIENYLTARGTHQETPQEMQKALRALEAAVKDAPQFAAAHGALSDLWSRIIQLEYRPVVEASASAREVAKAALAVEPDLAEAHLALGTAASYGDWDWKTARTEVERALALRPSYTYAMRRLGQIEETLGNTKAAVARREEAHTLDPTSQSLNVELGFAYVFDGQYDKALTLMNEVEKLDPEYRVLRLVRGLAYLGSKQYARATTHLDLLTNLRTWMSPALAIAVPAAAFDGRIEEARKGLNTLRNNPNVIKSDPVVVAGALLAVGQDADAYKLLDEAFETRNPLLLTLAVNPIFAPSRNDPRFRQLVSRITSR